MCEVTTALAAVSTISGLYGADRNAAAQSRALTRQRHAQREEIAANTSARQGERVKQARAERSRLRVAAGEAGVAGQSFESQLFDSYLQEDLDLATLEQDGRFADRASEARFQSGLSTVNSPTFVDAGLQIAGSVYNARQQSRSRHQLESLPR